MLGRCLAFLLSFCCCLGQRPLLPDLPSPRLVIVGPTGAGKSSLANALLGCDPRAGECLFEMCNTMNSCTKKTTYATGPWLGSEDNFTIVDTPGFGDSDNCDEELIEEMMDVLANTLDHADTLLLLIKGTETRFAAGLQKMLKRMTIIFGQGWWDFVVIGVSFWQYDKTSIANRKCYPNYPDYCKDEAWFEREINAQINEKFHVDKKFTYVFADSWSQASGPPGFNTDNDLQQEYWQNETTILWEITTNRDENFDFMTIDDILEENGRQKREIKRLNDIITDNITELYDRLEVTETAVISNKAGVETNAAGVEIIAAGVKTNKAGVKTNKAGVETNKAGVKTNKAGVKTNKAGVETNKAGVKTNKADIETNKADVGTNKAGVKTNKADIETNKADVGTNKDGVKTNKDDMDDLRTAPLGTIIAWVSRPTQDGEFAYLPEGWQRCDGSPIPPPSIWAGKTTPNLNGDKRFLRGGDDSEMLTMEEDRMQNHEHDIHDPGHTYIQVVMVTMGTKDQAPLTIGGSVLNVNIVALHTPNPLASQLGE